MAKQRRVSLRPIVNGIKSSQRSFKSMRKKLNLELKKLKVLEQRTRGECGGLYVFTTRKK